MEKKITIKSKTSHTLYERTDVEQFKIKKKKQKQNYNIIIRVIN